MDGGREICVRTRAPVLALPACARAADEACFHVVRRRLRGDRQLEATQARFDCLQIERLQRQVRVDFGQGEIRVHVGCRGLWEGVEVLAV